MNVNQDWFYVFYKDCDFATIHLTSSNIENNILIKHRINNECTTKKEEKNANQKLLQKSFQSILVLFFFFFWQLLTTIKIDLCVRRDNLFDILKRDLTIDCSNSSWTSIYHFASLKIHSLRISSTSWDRMLIFLDESFSKNS